MLTNNVEKYENFIAEMNGIIQTPSKKNGFFSKNNMIGKVVFNKNGKRLKFGKIYEDPIYHGFEYEKHPNQYEIRVKAIEPYEIKDKEKYKNNYTRWWISVNTDLKNELIVINDSGKKVVCDKELTKKLEILQNDLKYKEMEFDNI